MPSSQSTVSAANRRPIPTVEPIPSAGSPNCSPGWLPTEPVVDPESQVSVQRGMSSTLGRMSEWLRAIQPVNLCETTE